MGDGTLLILKGDEVLSLLRDREEEAIETVRLAYEAHAAGRSSLPHSTFLRFPEERLNRIIALPAYLNADVGGAGVKWVSSFPTNIHKGFDRASAVVILNSTTTGRPEAVLEGSVISATRTAASAALAARTLHEETSVSSVTAIGCGLINFEIQRFLHTVFPTIKRIYVYDINAERAAQFQRAIERGINGVATERIDDLGAALAASRLVSFATTAIDPYVADLSAVRPGSTILHISLRDLSAEAILSCDNVVDDADHVCQAQTSIHRAEQAVHNRNFIRCALADVTSGREPKRADERSVTVFSPFGLGVLDIAVARQVLNRAVREGKGTTIDSFFPEPWQQRV